MAASMTEQTLAIIKPDAIMAGKQAEILDMIGKNAFTLVSQDLVLLTPERAKAFYAEHDGKAFFEGLTDFMCSGPCLVLVLAKANGIKAWRALMGPTNSEVARASAPDRCAHTPRWRRGRARKLGRGEDRDRKVSILVCDRETGNILVECSIDGRERMPNT